MSRSLQELDYQKTPLGDLVLRRRRSPSLEGQAVHEVTLNGELLMSSIVTQSEKALATLALDRWGHNPCDVLIGGLGLGYTAVAVLGSPVVRRVRVVELLDPVIYWHMRRLLPASDTLMDDARCELVHEDFFGHIVETARSPERCYDLILLDIDHTPEAWLHRSHESFYAAEGLRGLVESLAPDGIFGLWSAKAPSGPFIQRLRSVFAVVEQHPIRYQHPMLHQQEENVVVIARQPILTGDPTLNVIPDSEA